MADLEDCGSLTVRRAEALTVRRDTTGIRWSRWDTDGAEILQGTVTDSIGHCPTWGPEGDLYTTSSGLGNLFGGDAVTLRRVDLCGRVRWSQRFDSERDSYTSLPPSLDRSGNVCVLVTRSPFHDAGRSPRCTMPTTARWMSVFAPNGDPRPSSDVTREDFRDSSHWDVTRCPTSNSPHGLAAVELRRASTFTVGDRSDPVTPVPTLVKYVPSGSLGCAEREHRCGGRCYDTATDAEHCGACGRACRFNNGIGRCIQGQCAFGGCLDAFSDDNHDPAAGGNGVAGGAGSVSRHYGSCSGRDGENGRGPDGGRAAVWALAGGRAWGPPYDGLGSTVPTVQCEEIGVAPFTYTIDRHCTATRGGGGSIGRAAAMDLRVAMTFQPGSGGGGGVPDRCDQAPGGGGGGGGGALRVVSATRVTLGPTGRLIADGGTGGRNAGAGSGGVIYLMAPAVSVAPGAVVEAVARGVPTTPITGLGRIRLSVDRSRCTLAGSFNPPLVDGCRPTPDEGVAGHTFIAPWPR